MSNDLLKPRYKVIADYPGNAYKLGDIITFVQDGCSELIANYSSVNGDRTRLMVAKKEFDKSPHLFKKLHWADERPVEQMPMYIKGRERVYEVTGWSKDIIGHFYPKNKVEVLIKDDSENFSNIEWHFFKDQFIPVTPADYEAYLQTLTVK